MDQSCPEHHKAYIFPKNIVSSLEKYAQGEEIVVVADVPLQGSTPKIRLENTEIEELGSLEALISSYLFTPPLLIVRTLAEMTTHVKEHPCALIVAYVNSDSYIDGSASEDFEIIRQLDNAGQHLIVVTKDTSRHNDLDKLHNVVGYFDLASNRLSLYTLLMLYTHPQDALRMIKPTVATPTPQEYN